MHSESDPVKIHQRFSMTIRTVSRILPFILLPAITVLVGCNGGGESDAAFGVYAQSTGSAASYQATAEAEEVMPISESDIATDSIAVTVTAPDELYENSFRAVSHSPLSTFSIDVDAASYSNVRGYLQRGTVPPPSIVRIEELVNYFSYEYPEPSGDHPFAFNTEVANCPWNPEHRLVRVALQGMQVPVEQLPPANLVFLIDVSGSMSSEEKLPLLKQSFYTLLDQLRPQDRVAIVAYAGEAGLVLKSTPGSDKDKIRSAIDRLESGGSTAGGAGISLAYKIAEKYRNEDGNNRVILATDGDFNVGLSSESELVTLIEQEREKGVFLSIIGFGTGNYQDRKMEQLADNGNGNYYYIDNLREGRRILANELSGTLYTIAKDVKLQIAFNPENVQAYRLIGYENRTLAARDFNDDRKDAGELGAGHSVTAFYEVVPVGSEVGYPVDQSKAEDYRLEDETPLRFTAEDLMVARLRYKQPNGSSSRLIEHLVGDNPSGTEKASQEFCFAAAVAEWGLLLRESSYGNNASFEQVLALAQGAVGTDLDGYRSEFIDLVKESAGLMGQSIASR